MNKEQFRRGVEEFNRGFFFECHDTLEELWMETAGNDRQFLQGLIQVAVGFYHFFNQNFTGAASQFTKGLDKLDRYRPAYGGIELERFSRGVVRWLATAELGLAGNAVLADETRVPKLQFSQRIIAKEN